VEEQRLTDDDHGSEPEEVLTLGGFNGSAERLYLAVRELTAWNTDPSSIRREVLSSCSPSKYLDHGWFRPGSNSCESVPVAQVSLVSISSLVC
jgi:hypothetical protein